MVSTILVILPIFALIFAGFASRKLDVLGPRASPELNRFVVFLALPALLFDIMAHATRRELYQPAFVAVFGLGCLIVFGLTLALRWRGNRHLADASIDGLNAAYANTGFIGFPLGLLVFGRASLSAVTIAAIITVCALFALAIILVESGLQAERRPAHLLLKVGRSLMRNPLLVAPVLGTLFAASGVPMPASIETFFKLLGGAASPCALVALGLFIAEKRASTEARDASPWLLVGLKLIVHPAVTWVLAFKVFFLPPALGHLAVVLAALPTGTGPFMLAEFYQREAVATSRTILVSTIGSIFTLTLYLYFTGAHAM
jgi:malonate transporter and related proteins